MTNDEINEAISKRAAGLDLTQIFRKEGRTSYVELDENGKVVVRQIKPL